jgi:Kef-type K+ transport system membrane component KefB
MTSLVFLFFIIFVGAALFSVVALYARQPLLVAYIVVGAIVGPWGLKWVGQTDVIHEMSEIGIMFLLFLLGLNLRPKMLLSTLKDVVWVTWANTIFIAALGMLGAHLFKFGWPDSVVIGVALGFSSTIVGLKLLPAKVLYHEYAGRLTVGILLLQDIIAIAVLLVLDILGGEGTAISWVNTAKVVLAIPVLICATYFINRYVLTFLMKRFVKVHEFLFLLAIGWCLGLAMLAHVFGVSYDIGAFIAGVGLASSDISQYIADQLRPLRDFFLIIFFFAIGAGINYHDFGRIVWPLIVLSAIVLILKPLGYRFLLGMKLSHKSTAWEIGLRLGQASEFSLLIAYMAHQAGFLMGTSYLLLQSVTVLTFLVSSCVVSFAYPDVSQGLPEQAK